jgi:threonine/homoserine/homoserine lactone efflux protein
MGQAIGEVLTFAVGVAISPLPIIGVILMLATPRAKSDGLAFMAGWIGGLAVVGGAVLLFAGGAGATDQGAPADWTSYLELGLGLVLLNVARKQWQGRPKDGEDPDMPGWMQKIDTYTARNAAILGVLLAAVNPKNLLLVVGAASAIAKTGASTGDQIVALIVFIVIASIGVATPLIVYFAMGDRSQRILEDLKQKMTHNNAAIMAVICVIIAAKLIGSAISQLSA